MVTCSRCGTEAREGARFCGVCGQPTATDRPSAAGKSAGFPAPVPAESASASGPVAGRTTAMIAGGAAVLAVLVLVAVLVTQAGSDSESADVETDSASTDASDDAGDAGDTGDAGDSGSEASEPEPPPTTRPAPAEILTPVSVSASRTRESVGLRCGGTADYRPQNLFDGNPNTGWGASADDGAGQSVTVDFGREVHLTQVGITPGFTKVGPRADQGCAAVNAFPFNRFVAEVQWTFDDGSSVSQTFDRRGTLQRTRVDVTTTTLTMRIVRTEFQGWDTDTVISSMEVRGSR